MVVVPLISPDLGRGPSLARIWIDVYCNVFK